MQMLALKKNLLVQQGDARAAILNLLQEGVRTAVVCCPQSLLPHTMQVIEATSVPQQHTHQRVRVIRYHTLQAAPPEVIMLDCYDAEGTIPKDLTGGAFCQEHTASSTFLHHIPPESVHPAACRPDSTLVLVMTPGRFDWLHMLRFSSRVAPKLEAGHTLQTCTVVVTMPAMLAGATFLGACVEVLKPGGLLLANLFNNKVGSHARLRFAHYAVQVSTSSGHGHAAFARSAQAALQVVLAKFMYHAAERPSPSIKFMYREAERSL